MERPTQHQHGADAVLGEPARLSVTDEPLYAAYLAATGLDHPLRDEVIAAGDTDGRRVAAWLTGPCPAAARSGTRSTWRSTCCRHGTRLGACAHQCAADPRPGRGRRVPLEALKSRATVVPTDIGLLQQAALYDELLHAGSGEAPLVIDADDFPSAIPRPICARCARTWASPSTSACCAGSPGRARRRRGRWRLMTRSALDRIRAVAAPFAEARRRGAVRCRRLPPRLRAAARSA